MKMYGIKQLGQLSIRSLSSGTGTGNASRLNSLGFIGFGKIAQAMSLGLINKNLFNADQIFASDKFICHLDNMKSSNRFKDLNINFCTTNQELIKNVDAIVLSVKPTDIKSLLKDISSHLSEKHLILSIVAGVKLDDLHQLLPEKSRIMRIMTNLPALVQEGCSVYAKGKNCSIEDGLLVRNFLRSIGTCEGEMSEELFDAFTALSGSGPAYMCAILDALADGALKEGIGKELALKIAAQTMYGTSAMILNDFKHIYQLRDDVCSPGGTTISGLIELDRTQFRYALIKCIEASTRRAKELSNLDGA